MNSPNPIREAYLKGLKHFSHVLNDDFKVENRDMFIQMLQYAFWHFGLIQDQMAYSIQVNKSSISKWVNGQTLPNIPTRKVVLIWIQEKINEQLRD